MENIANNATATLASSVTDTDTEWTLTTGHGARMPDTPFILIARNGSGDTGEIVRCTSRTGDVLTVDRAVEPWLGEQVARSFDSGDTVSNTLTAGQYTGLARFIKHDDDADAARPGPEGGLVIWIGSVEPENAESQDLVFLEDAPEALDPTTIDGFALGYEADTLELNDDDPVGTWEGIDVAVPDMTSSGSDRPIFKADVVNGLPAVLFEASSSHTMQAEYSGLTGTDQPFTLIVACRVATDGNRPMAGIGRADTSTNPMHVVRQRSESLASTFRRDDSGDSSNVEDGTLATGQWLVVTLVFDGTDSTVYVSKTAQATATQDHGTLTLDRAMIGSNRPSGNSPSAFFDGHIFGVLLYEGVVGVEDREALIDRYEAMLGIS